MTLNLDDRARQILRDNDRGGYTVPTAGLYPYQWNWDSVFSALGFSTFDPGRAWDEIETLFAAQWPDGMVPHIVFRVDEPTYFPGPAVWGADKGAWPSSGISQPPVAATAVRTMAETDPARARALLPKIEAWHRWWHTARDPDGLGVIATIHPWETGRDNLPDWDAPGESIDVSNVGTYERRDTKLVDADMRPKKRDYDRYIALVQFGRSQGWDQAPVTAGSPFLVADVGITAILLRAERDLLALQTQFGEPTEAVTKRIARMEAGFDRLWNPAAGGYCSLDLRGGTGHAPAATSASFLAFYAGITERREALNTLFDAFAAHAEYMVPSFDPRDANFDHLRYWRGPVWGIVNYMIGQGLSEQGDTARAARVRADTARLIAEHGFAEYFSPVDGRGCGGGTFSWTAAIWLAWELSAT